MLADTFDAMLEGWQSGLRPPAASSPPMQHRSVRTPATIGHPKKPIPGVDPSGVIHRRMMRRALADDQI